MTNYHLSQLEFHKCGGSEIKQTFLLWCYVNMMTAPQEKQKQEGEKNFSRDKRGNKVFKSKKAEAAEEEVKTYHLTTQFRINSDDIIVALLLH